MCMFILFVYLLIFLSLPWTEWEEVRALVCFDHGCFLWAFVVHSKSSVIGFLTNICEWVIFNCSGFLWYIIHWESHDGFQHLDDNMLDLTFQMLSQLFNDSHSPFKNIKGFVTLIRFVLDFYRSKYIIIFISVPLSFRNAYRLYIFCLTVLSPYLDW